MYLLRHFTNINALTHVSTAHQFLYRDIFAVETRVSFSLIIKCIWCKENYYSCEDQVANSSGIEKVQATEAIWWRRSQKKGFQNELQGNYRSYE
jgi:hypothetical protein